MNEPVDEMDLERYLQRRDPLSRAYDELREEMPSDKVNRAVLQAARAATSSDARPRNPWNAFWLRRAALAATLVLCVAVVLQINVNKHGELVPAAPADKEDSAAPEPYSVQLIAPATRDAPVGGVAPTATPAAEAPQVGGGTSPARMSRPAEAAAPATPPPASSDQSYESERSAPAQAKTEADAQAAPEEKSANGMMDGVSRRESTAAQDEKSRPAMNRMSTVLKKAGPNEAGAMTARDPEEWLKAIEALRAAGDMASAEKEMELFNAAYPHYLETRSVAPTK